MKRYIKSSRIIATTYKLFHGSGNSSITEFDIGLSGTNTHSGEHFLFFTDSLAIASEFSYERIPTNSMFFDKRGKQGSVYEVEVTMNHPLDLTNLSDADVQNLINLSDGELTAEMVYKFSQGNNQILKAYIDLDRIADFGYDGFIAKMNNNGDLEYAVSNSQQVKLKGII